MNRRREHHRFSLIPARAVGAKRRAFTLLEVLLALSLSVILLMAVYGAFDLYLRFATVGHDDMEQSQIARALLRRLSSDIRSVVFRPPTANTGSGSGSGSGSGNRSNASGGSGNQSGSGSGNSGGAGNQSSNQSGNSSGGSNSGSGTNTNSNSSSNSGSNAANENAAVDATTGFSQAMTGLVGDSTTLVMHVARATRSVGGQSQAAIVEGVPANSGEEKSVSYFLADTGADGLAGMVADSYKKANGTTGDIQGLARLEGNRLAIQIVQEQSNLETLAESVKLLAPEVTGLQFRYFDGVDWLDAWDSGVSQRLPQAVEILLKVRRTGGSAKKATTRRDEEPLGDVYHLTVAIPSAEPYVAP